MFISKTLNFYKRQDVRQTILDVAENKEIAVKYGERGFGKRPDILQYKNDLLEHAKKGVTSFHCSEELWYNPLQISTNMRPEELADLRKGWDLVLDIDCKFLEYSKIAGYYCIKALKSHGIKSITCKFSGNKGFHIAVPFEAFPSTIGGRQTKLLFPEAPRRIAAYIKHLIKDSVSKAIMRLEKNDFEKIVKKTEKKPNEILREEKNEFGDIIYSLNAEPFLDIDTILISSRHLFRMPYSFHEKSQLVSIPIKPEDILKFKKEHAKPENIKKLMSFLERNAEKNEASKLVLQAFDFEISIKEDNTRPEVQREYEELSEALPDGFFPPCMKKLMEGLEDGRKRSLFIFTNFLSNIGWNKDEIEEKLHEWNANNREPLREVNIKGHVRYHLTQKKKKVLPPNCPHASKGSNYYSDIGLCHPDNLCKRIKNPINYTIIKSKEISKKNPKLLKKEAEKK
ncbi:DNA primase small subunit domain-containing protein [Bacteroidota bacterium]